MAQEWSPVLECATREQSEAGIFTGSARVRSIVPSREKIAQRMMRQTGNAAPDPEPG
jgi:hypothetical protein